MKSLVVIAAMALTLMAAGCMQHEQPRIGAKTGTEVCPKPDPLRYERQNLPKAVLFMGIAWFGVIILMAMIWVVLDV